jgi:hypothetical protein
MKQALILLRIADATALGPVLTRETTAAPRGSAGRPGLPRRAGTRPPGGGRNLRRLEELLGGLGTAERRTSC